MVERFESAPSDQSALSAVPDYRVAARNQILEDHIAADWVYTREQIFGPLLTLAGFPPWLVRHSEIYGMGNLAKAHCDTVNEALQRYCRTTQRFGT